MSEDKRAVLDYLMNKMITAFTKGEQAQAERFNILYGQIEEMSEEEFANVGVGD